MNYDNLKISGRQIRLITIHSLAPSQSETAPIHCTIETAKLPAEPENWDPVDFDGEVTNAPHEPFGGSFRRDVANIEGTADRSMS
ncbi:heterokaryon incompatibility protein [Colletotrichum incanum]|uniref:Heterokaryon incompatibility protein n=1 Tax=Colletotrichum incanum TaxID=1573173 RepID=A0A162N8L5_COLIC|nr:heterokaryon incompatibility protein [Colletotrichum incanum]